MDSRRLLTDVLKGVSRSFYLTIRVLPAGLRQPVAVAYLLARAADTIADTRALSPPQRLERLLAFRAQVQEPTSQDAIAGIVTGIRQNGDGASQAETALLGALGQVFDLLEALPMGDREQVRRVVVTLTRGMELDLTNFPAEDSGSLSALRTPEELDCYTYLVAGCVGEFWTVVAMAHQPRISRWDAERMSALGVRFGKALQLTNVLRDIPRDLRNGRCYLPQDDLLRAGVSPNDLLDPSNAAHARGALTLWIRTALEHFDAAEEYLLATPRRCLRLRLAALWPILLGLATLDKLARNEAWLDPSRPMRVKRRWVYGMMARSLLAGPSDTLLRFWIRSLRRRVEKALDGI
jgi:farnesyl-diphosphate farnesyltransferase